MDFNKRLTRRYNLQQINSKNSAGLQDRVLKRRACAWITCSRCQQNAFGLVLMTKQYLHVLF